MTAAAPGGEPEPDTPDAGAELSRIRAEVLARLPRPGKEDLPSPPDQGVPVPSPQQLYPAGPTPTPLIPELPADFLQAPTVDVHFWHGVWTHDVPVAITSHRKLGGMVVALKKLLRRFVRAPIADLFDRQRAYNTILTHNIAALQESVRILSEKTAPGLLLRGDALHAVADQRTEALDARVTDVEGRVRAMPAELGEALRGLHQHTEAVRGALSAARDELLLADRAALDLLQQSYEKLRRAIDDVRAMVQAGAATAPGAASPAAAAAAPAPAGVDAYLDFENAYRGPEELIRSKQRFYLPYFRGAPGPVVDLGAGRGEFLELCRQEAIPAYGVDGHPSMVERCHGKGLDVRQGDLMAHLASLADASLGGIFMAQVIEHLPRTELVALARLCRSKLAAGGRLAIESVNPLSPIALSRNFFLDLTHERPLHPEGLRFLLEATGFSDVDVAFLSPFEPHSLLPRLASDGGADPAAARLRDQVNATVDRLNEVLFGFQDFAVVATR